MYNRQFTASKGDPLCPLGFHPQVRWPTRCKRCFRDYKEHGGRNKDGGSDSLRRDDLTTSTPSLSWSSTPSRSRDDSRSSTDSSTSSWVTSRTDDKYSSSNESTSSRFGTSRPASSWTSTPDLGNLKDDTQADATFSFTLPKRKPQPPDTGQDTSYSSSNSTVAENTRQKASPARATVQNDQNESSGRLRRVKIQSLKEVPVIEETTNPEVAFIIQVKSSKNKQAEKNKAVNSVSKTTSATSHSSSSSSSGTSSEESHEESDDDATSTAGTETTETTLVGGDSLLQDQIDSLKQELDTMRCKCERLEREKSDILLRRIAGMDMAPSKTTASENLKLQQKVNDLQTQMEDLQDDKKSLALKVKELEEELDARPDRNATQRAMDELRSKLLAAETLCEELMDENEDMKKELRDLEEEIEEMQDNFREDQADEYTSLKKELEQTAKNCRILSFKLRKAERKAEQMEADKLEAEKKLREVAGGQSGLDRAEKVKHLEKELEVANEVAKRLQKELEEANLKLKAHEEANNKADQKVTTKRAPKLGSVGKSTSGEKVSRETLTRGGSQDDPAQLLRDLQDAMEREADLREQLRFAEEEAQTFRKKSARVEDDNESLVLQLKKMATKARSHRQSPSPARLTPEPSLEKDEGISDEDDPAELRLLLELNEQEAAVLRRKVEDLEKEGETLKKKVKDLQDKLSVKASRKSSLSSITTSEPSKENGVLYEQKVKVMEDELSELRKKLIEKDRDYERLYAELTVTQKRFSKSPIQKSKSLDGDQQTLDLKRQLQVIEQEAAVLRTRTQTLEGENEKLSAENKRLQLIRSSKKGAVSAVSENSEKLDELKDKISSLEAQLTEANTKINELQGKLDEHETNKTPTDPKKKVTSPEVSKLKKDMKAKTDELDKLKIDFTKFESENKKLNEIVKRLKDDAIKDAVKYYKQRSPKKPTDFTTKLQMKKMVEDLESEIGDILVVLSKSETENTKLKEVKSVSNLPSDSKQSADAIKKLEKELEESKKKITTLENELEEEREKSEKDKKKTIKDKKLVEEGKKKAEDDKQKLEVEKKKLEEIQAKLQDENRKLLEEKEKLLSESKNKEELIIKLNAEKAAAIVKQDEVSVFVQRIEGLKTELEDEKKQCVELRKKVDTLQKYEQEKNKLQKDVTEKNVKVLEMEKKVKEIEEKLKKSEKLLSTTKNKAAKLEKELEEEKEHARTAEVTQQGVAASWLAERDSLKQQLAKLQGQIDSLEATLAGKTVLIEQLELTVKEERDKATDASEKASTAERNEISSLKDALSTSKGQVEELTQKLEKSDKNIKAAEEKLKKLEAEYKKEKTESETKITELETNLQAEKKKSERQKVAQEKELKNREQELTSLRSKIRSLENNTGTTSKKMSELRQEYQEKIDKLEEELANEKQEYEDLTTKYEILEEEHVVTKAQLVMEKETLQGQLLSTKRELGNTETELRTLRETYNTKQDTWIKEKLDLQERLKELEEKVSRNNGSEAWNQERTRLKTIIDEKNSEIEQLQKEAHVLADQMDHLRKEGDDLRKKLDDFDKVSKIQRNISADNTAFEKELRELKSKLLNEEKSHKSEVAQLKMRYDSRVALIGEEIQTLQSQVSRFKRERDNYRHMLDAAQKTIADLKVAPKPSKDTRPSSFSGVDEAEETRNNIASLEQQISCMEDELSEARLESSKLKTELVSERSSWEVKRAEMQSRVNELEEERVLSSGRTKIAGMRTRLELAWHKEREEQHRLLQETSTLARDLRQTLFEVERERDKERLESKRRIDQLKKTTEEEQEENKKKITELQCDLLELRDAHAKLRTTNEKLRREKERNEKERDELKQLISGRKRADQEEDRKVTMLIQQVDELMRFAPDLFRSREKTPAGPTPTTPTPPRRLKGPKSRESSPSLERKEFVKESSVDRKSQLQTTMQRLTEATEELRKYQKIGEEERERERAKRSMGIRRAASTESDNPPDSKLRSKKSNGSTGIQKKGSLYRKSLSLEQTSAGQEQQSIWTDDEHEGSLSSLQSVGSESFYPLQRRETSLDSRLSGGSTQSEVIHSGEKKKKKGILGKLKKLTKSRSIDETTSGIDYASDTGQGSNLGGSGSDISMGGAEDSKGSKKDLRDRFTGMFKKSSSRSNSLERSRLQKDQSPALSDHPESTNTSKKGSSSTLPRPSPARSESGPTSSMARPLSPGIKRPTTPTISSVTQRKGK